MTSGGGAKPAGEESQMTPDDVMRERDGLIRKMETLIADGDALEQFREELAGESEALHQRVRGLAMAEAVLQKRKRALQADLEALGQRKNEYLQTRQRIQEAYDDLEASVSRCDELLVNAEVDDTLEVAFTRPPAQRAPWPVAGAEAGPAAREPEPEPAPEPEPPADEDGTRRQPRLAVAVDVDLHSQHHFYTGFTENLSEGGLFVASYDVFPVGSEIDVTINLEEMPPIHTKAVVRWVRHPGSVSEEIAPGMGVQFLDLSEEERGMIRAFMEVREPMFLDGLE